MTSPLISNTSTPFNTISPNNFWMNITQSDLDYLASLASNQSSVSPEYCGPGWEVFRKEFSHFHGVFSIIVCIFGLITNILNIIVLTRRDMASPTNTILTGLALADMLVMVDYLPFAIHTYIPNNYPKHVNYSYAWAVFVLFHAHFSVVCHTISIGLTLTLAVWRFIAVTFPQSNREWCSKQRSCIAILGCYLFSPIFCIPVYLAFEIHESVEFSVEEKRDVFLYHVQLSRIASENNNFLQKLNFWIYSVLIKIIPCVALTVLSLRLIRALYKANLRKLLLKNRCPDGSTSCSVSAASNTDRSCDRTTHMLLAVLILFLITEFPQGILALLSGILGEKFFQSCYSNVSEVMDFLALINSAINFILYCVMSRQFRLTFSHLFKPQILNNWMAIPQEATTHASTCV